MIVFMLAGCTYGTEQFKSIMSDPHYKQYQEKLDKLETSYLNGNTDYPEYLERKKEIEETYTIEVQRREEVIQQ